MGDFESVIARIQELLNGIYVKSQQKGYSKARRVSFFTKGPIECDLNLPASGPVLGSRLAGAGTNEYIVEFELSYVKKLSNEPNQYYFAQLSANESGYDFTERGLLVDPGLRIGKTLSSDVLETKLETYEDAAPILEGDLIPYLETLQYVDFANEPTAEFSLIRDVLASDNVLE
jgi:hypothetical protein